MLEGRQPTIPPGRGLVLEILLLWRNTLGINREAYKYTGERYICGERLSTDESNFSLSFIAWTTTPPLDNALGEELYVVNLVAYCGCT